MDTRTGQLYPTKELAIADNVPEKYVKEVDVVMIESGPFKGRKYVRTSDGRLGRRVFDDSRSKTP
jgi:hypothetical protein